MKIKLSKDEATVEDDNSLITAMFMGCKKKIKIKTPYGTREIKKVKKEKF